MTRNWGTNHRYPRQPSSPTSLDELREIIVRAGERGQTIRPLGSRHSFNAISDAEVMLELGQMPEVFEVDPGGRRVTVNAAMTFGRFATLAEPAGFALHNLGSLPHISIAGAVATGTHGSGDRNGNIATAVVGLELMTSDGELEWLSKSELAGSTVALGARGIVTRIELVVEPSYLVAQTVYEHLPWTALDATFDQVFSSAYSVSAFTNWNDRSVRQLWVKHRLDEPDPSALILGLGGVPSPENRHPIYSQPPDACTEQLGTPGLWSDRLPHFRMDFTPSTGEEIQTEYFVGRADAPAAVAALRAIGSELGDTLLASEIRTVAADSLWMSPCFERDSVAFHFTWGPDQLAAERAADEVLSALEPFEPRPHWGKVFPRRAAPLSRLPHGADFTAGVDRRFVNRWTVEHGVSEVADDVVLLDTGAAMPRLGMGTFGSDHVSGEKVAEAVETGLRLGYRHIDCASVYGNEAEIGDELAAAQAGGLLRSDLWISSKVWNDAHSDVGGACRRTLRDLRLDYLDMYLVHWPFANHHPPECDVDERNPEALPYDHHRFIETWQQMESLVTEGLVRHVGTSNMTRSKLEPLLAEATITPSVNQMELHPHFQQTELVNYLMGMDIVPIGFCPIGSPERPERDRTPDDTSPSQDPVLVEIARRRGVHPAAVCIKWALQRGHVPIPFSTSATNIKTNLDQLSNEPLTGQEMAAIAGADRDNRLIKGQVFLWPEATDWSDLWI